MASLLGVEEKHTPWRVPLRLGLNLEPQAHSSKLKAAPENAVDKTIGEVHEITVFAGEHLKKICAREVSRSNNPHRHT
jgi:hypothetical protein